MTADRFIYHCPGVSAVPPLGPISNALESLLQDYKLVFVYFHHLKSNVALVGLQWLRAWVCVMCIYVCIWVWVVFFYEWVEDGLRDQFATLFDHCKYEFRLFSYRELEWSLILHELDTNFRHLGVISGITERGWWFFICSEKAAFTGSLVKSTSHWLSGWFDTRLFFCGIQQWSFQQVEYSGGHKGMKEGHKRQLLISPQSVNWFSLICEPQGHCLILQQRPISINPILFVF